MKHEAVIDKIYEDENLTFLARLEIAFHILGCKSCAREAARYENAREIMQSAFFDEKLTGESSAAPYVMSIIEAKAENAAQNLELPQGEFTIRDWGIAGVVIIAALITVFFGVDAGALAKAFGSDFTVPLALVIGLVITAYIAVFTGRHLKMLTEKFGLTDD